MRSTNIFNNFGSIVWRKASVVPGYPPNVWRYDVRGNPICWTEYGNLGSPFGWEIAHIVPPELGGTDVIGNLQVLHVSAIPRAAVA